LESNVLVGWCDHRADEKALWGRGKLKNSRPWRSFKLKKERPIGKGLRTGRGKCKDTEREP